MFEDDSDRHYRVVRNHEHQYSIWPVDRTLPPGWEEAGGTGLKSECLDQIRQIWTDMRPRSLREEAAA